LTDLQTMVERIWSATCRSTLIVAMVLSLAVNTANGAFARIVHEHDHEHGQQHVHDHGEDRKHLDDHDDGMMRASEADDGRTPSANHNKVHEHGAVVTLALTQSGKSPVFNMEPVVIFRPHTGVITDVKHQPERPPRRI
jgi:ABC-type nickel/cobalt efflux system permease component RcnA